MLASYKFYKPHQFNCYLWMYIDKSVVTSAYIAPVNVAYDAAYIMPTLNYLTRGFGRGSRGI